MKIAITGSNGFIGTKLRMHLECNGVKTIGLCRTPDAKNDYAFDLTNLHAAHVIPKDVDLVIHNAYTMQGKDLKKAYQINVEGSLRLFEYCHQHKIKILFMSSCSAHDKAQSFYGRSKYDLEKYLNAADCIVRPGFVIGNGSIYQRLEDSIGKLRFAPLFWGGQQPIQIVAINDLLDGILALITQEKSGAYNLVYDKPCTIKEFYAHIFKRRQQSPHFIHLPGNLTLHGLRLTEQIGINLPLTSENLLGLKHLKTFESNFKELGLTPIPLEMAQQIITNQADRNK
jgi:nucleoside-diphosphate-sugar epimerase